MNQWELMIKSCIDSCFNQSEIALFNTGSQDDIIKKLQNFINDLKIQLEQNIHDNQIEHEADDNTKEIISELFKSLEERVPGNSIDMILKQVLTEQTLVRTCNIYFISLLCNILLFHILCS
jgi:hypothetical protein